MIREITKLEVTALRIHMNNLEDYLIAHKAEEMAIQWARNILDWLDEIEVLDSYAGEA